MAIDATRTRELLKEIDSVFGKELLAYFPFAPLSRKSFSSRRWMNCGA